MEPDAALPDPGEPAEDGPIYPWLPPEDRLWRHPSEAAALAGPLQSSAGPPRAPVAAADNRRVWAIGVVAGLVGALAASGIGVAGGLWPQRTTVVRPSFPASAAVSLADAGAPQANWTAVDDSVAPSVVGVSVQGPAGPQQASGLIVATTLDRAYVVTDRSVLDPAGYGGIIQVSFLSGAAAQGAVVGEDPLTGLALIRVDNVDREIPAATGSVSSLHDADPVMAVAARTSPGGSVFPGSVTSQDRQVTLTDGSDRDGLIAVTLPSLPQAASGGPVLDGYGQVVGVTIGVDSPDPADQRLTFAVPVDTVTRVADDLIRGRTPTHAWLGVTNATDLPSALARRYGLVGGVQAGAVYPTSPAGRAGVRAHDIVTTFDGRPVASTGALVAALAGIAPGRTVPITFLHSGHGVRADVTLGSEPPDAGGS